MSLYGAAGSLELVLGGLLMLGLLTRPVAFILSGEMAFAYFMGHCSSAQRFIPLLNGGNAAILFCFACLYLVLCRRRTVERGCDDGKEAVGEQSSSN